MTFENYTEFINSVEFNRLASYYMQLDYTDCLIDLLETNKGLLSEFIQVELSVDTGNYLNASVIIDSLIGEEVLGDEGFNADLQNISVDLAANTLTWDQISYDDLETIKNIAAAYDREAIQAKLLLEYLSGINYDEPIYDVDIEITAEDLRQINNIYPPSELNTINVYPHPTELKSELIYWNRFYKKYSEYLYSLGCFDNYVGSHFKIIRTFFSYLNLKRGIFTGTISELNTKNLLQVYIM